MVILLIHGAAGVVGASAVQLILHDMVGAAELPSGIRLNASSRFLSILFGPAVGGGLMLLVGPAWGLLANVLIYAPLTILLLRIPYTGHTREASAPRPTRRARLGETLRRLGGVGADGRILTMIVLGGAAALFVGNAFQAQMPSMRTTLAPTRRGSGTASCSRPARPAPCSAPCSSRP